MPGMLQAYGVSYFLLNFIDSDHKDTDINCVTLSSDKKVLCVADSLGRPRLFTYPAFHPRQACTQVEGGHVSHVLCAAFLVFKNKDGEQEDEVLITAGEIDQTIMVWKFNKDAGAGIIKVNGRHMKKSSGLQLQLSEEEKNSASSSPLNISLSSKQTKGLALPRRNEDNDISAEMEQKLAHTEKDVK